MLCQHAKYPLLIDNLMPSPPLEHKEKRTEYCSFSGNKVYKILSAESQLPLEHAVYSKYLLQLTCTFSCEGSARFKCEEFRKSHDEVCMTPCESWNMGKQSHTHN